MKKFSLKHEVLKDLSDQSLSFLHGGTESEEPPNTLTMPPPNIPTLNNTAWGLNSPDPDPEPANF